MTSYGSITQRPNVPPSSSPQPQEEDGNPKNQFTCQITFPFSIPSTPESAAAKIIRNTHTLGLYYFEFIWISLFISLIPQRKLSLIILTATKEAAIVYLLLMRAVPASLVLLRKILDKRIVLPLLGLGTAIALIATDSGLHLVITMAVTVPIILAHAGLWCGWVVEPSQKDSTDVHEYQPLV